MIGPRSDSTRPVALAASSRPSSGTWPFDQYGSHWSVPPAFEPSPPDHALMLTWSAPGKEESLR